MDPKLPRPPVLQNHYGYVRHDFDRRNAGSRRAETKRIKFMQYEYVPIEKEKIIAEALERELQAVPAKL